MGPELLEINGIMHEISYPQPPRALILALLLASGTDAPWAQERLVLDPAAGTRRTKTIERHETLTLDQLEVTLDGRDVSRVFRTLDFAVENRLELRVRDEYKDVVDGRLTALERSFEELRLSSTQELYSRTPGSGEPRSVEATSPLEKRRLGFVREGSGAPRVEPVDGGPALEPALTRGLKMELDATAFLPKLPVMPEDRWQVDPSLVGPLLSPCGELHFTTAGTDAGPLAPFGTDPAERYEGEVRARFEGVVESLGRRLARIVLEVRLTGTRELGPDEAAFRPAFPGPAGLVPTRHLLRTRFEGTGLMEWNLTANVLETFELTGEGGVSLLFEGVLSSGALEQQWRQETGLVGSRTLSITCRN